MKKLLILSLVALALYGCGAAEDPTTTTPTTPQPIDISDAGSLLDSQIFNEATASGDVERCEDIENEATVESCKTVAQSNAATAAALESGDTSNCDDIADERFKENCVTAVEEKIEAEEEVAKEAGKLQAEADKESAISQKAVDSGDISICEELEDKTQTSSCRYNILANQALVENNPKLCDEIGDQEFIDLCRENFESSIQ